MTTITYECDGEKRTGAYALRDDGCDCDAESPRAAIGDWRNRICLPGDPGERGYGYSHGGERYRALIDAIVERHGAEAIRAARPF